MTVNLSSHIKILLTWFLWQHTLCICQLMDCLLDSCQSAQNKFVKTQREKLSWNDMVHRGKWYTSFTTDILHYSLLSTNASDLSCRYCYQDTFFSHYSFDLLFLNQLWHMSTTNINERGWSFIVIFNSIFFYSL